MSIEIKCKCGCDYRLDDSRGGEQFSCKVCGAEMTLPAGVGRAVPADQARVQAAAGGSVVASTPPATTAVAPAAPADSGSLMPMGGDLQNPVSRAAEPATRPQAEAGHIGQTLSPGFQPMAYADPDDKRRPPLAWCIGRLAMWALCVGFLFMPWFSMSGGDPQTGQDVTQSITGWQIVKGVVEGAHAAGQAGANGAMPSMSEFTNVPDGAGRVIAGGGMMVFSPLAYAAGLALVLIFAPVAYVSEGRGAMWPFVGCFLGLMGFIIGWHLIAGAEPFKQILSVASQVGVSIGVSVWAYVMGVVLILLCFIARGKPDFNLVHAIQWSDEHANPRSM